LLYPGLYIYVDVLEVATPGPGRYGTSFPSATWTQCRVQCLPLSSGSQRTLPSRAGGRSACFCSPSRYG